MSFIDTLLNFLKLVSINSIEESLVTDRVILCCKLKEFGIVRLKIRKGVVPFPQLLYFPMPQGSKVDEVQEYLGMSDFILYSPTKGYQIDVSKIGSSKIQELSIKYERYVRQDVFNVIKIEKDVEKIHFINNSDLNFIGYKATARILLPVHLRDIMEFDEQGFKKYVDKKLKIIDDKGNVIEPLSDYNIYLKGTRLEIETSWLTDINPNATKSFTVNILPDLSM